MADDGQQGHDQAEPEPTADECVRAGMYWFGRSDFQAAQAWWERAVELDPRNTRALECLRLLNKTSSTGFKSDDVNPFEAPSPAAPAAPVPQPPEPRTDSGFGRSDHSGFTPGPSAGTGSGFTPGQPSSSGFTPGPAAGTGSGFTPGPSSGTGSGFSPTPGNRSSNPGWTPSPQSMDLGTPPLSSDAPVILGPGSRPAHTPAETDQAPAAAPSQPTSSQTSQDIVTTDPFDFAAHGQHHVAAPSPPPPPVRSKHSPWDEGPSRTSVVTIQDSGGFDAVPEPTPLPEIDRERFFGRGDPESQEEIVSFLKATGDLPPAPSGEFATQQSGEYQPATMPMQAPEPIVPAQPGLTIPEPVPQPLAAMPPAPVVPETPAPAAPPPGPPMMMDVPASVSSEIVFDDPVEMDDASTEPPPDFDAILQDARDRFGLHDFDGALERIDALPPDLQQTDEVRNLVAESRRNLLRMYESKIGDFERVPRVLISEEEVIWLNVNHRAGFILSQIDGTVTYEDLVALSGMPRLDTIRILADLIDKKVVG